MQFDAADANHFSVLMAVGSMVEWIYYCICCWGLFLNFLKVFCTHQNWKGLIWGGPKIAAFKFFLISLEYGQRNQQKIINYNK